MSLFYQGLPRQRTPLLTLFPDSIRTTRGEAIHSRLASPRTFASAFAQNTEYCLYRLNKPGCWLHDENGGGDEKTHAMRSSGSRRFCKSLRLSHLTPSQMDGQIEIALPYAIVTAGGTCP